MALNKTALQAALQATFADVSAGKTAATAATELADAIDTYVKTALATVTIPVGAVVVIPGTGGALNVAPIPVTGDPGAGTGGLT